MSKSIRLSENHGVNPTIPVCFWCGKEKNEIALLGRLKGDMEAPRNALLDYQPCEECKKKWAKAIMLIGVTDTPKFSNQPPICMGNGKLQYPTGSCVGLTEHGVRSFFKEDVQDEIIKSKSAFVDDSAVQRIINGCPF